MKINGVGGVLDEIRAISYFSTSLNEKESIEEVLWDVTNSVIHRLGFVDCVVYAFDKKRNVLVQKAAYGQKNPSGAVIYNQIEIPLGKGIVGHVALNKKAEIIPNTLEDPRYIVDDEARYSELCVPIFINDQLFGIIDSEHPEKSFFTEKHLHLLTIVAALCSQKIKELRAKNRKILTTASKYFKKLETLMRTNKIYRNPNLSLLATANLLGISACYLSSMINTTIKVSFIDYINQYRISEVKRNLLSSQYSHYTIVSVGLEAGFNSKSAFYTAFKKHTGITPSFYKQHTAPSSKLSVQKFEELVRL